MQEANEIMSVMDNIQYGFKDEFGNNIMNYDPDKWEYEFSSFYYLQTPEELFKSECGVCWDQVEAERYLFFKKNIPVKTYFVYISNEKTNPSHTFLTYELNGTYFWFEHSWEKYKGIHKYSDEKSLLESVLEKFLFGYDNPNVHLYEYMEPKKHITCEEFFKYIETQKEIKVGDKND